MNLKTMKMIVITNPNRDSFKIGDDTYLNHASDIDEGVITPSMGLPKKYWYKECIILVVNVSFLR